jgi:hypothetical protein
MPSAARLNLESLLRARQLDRTLTTALPAREPGGSERMVPTGIPALDEQLGGGVPRGEISEMTGTRSSGRTSLLFALLAAATARGELVAVMDTCDTLDPQSAAAAGIDLRRLLWVRGEALSAGAALGRAPSGAGQAGSDERCPIDRLVERSLKALNLILQAGGFDIVALDLVDVPVVSIRRIPFPTWLRLHRVIEGSRTACVLVASEPVARSAGGVTIALGTRARAPSGVRPREVTAGRAEPADTRRGARVPGIWAGDASHPRLFGGLMTEARLLSARTHGEHTPCRITFLE